MPPSRTKHAALYARVSTLGHGQDVGLQLDELRRVATQRGWTTQEYVDAGVSGTSVSRPALDRMLADAQAGKIDVVVVWKLDRLGRSLQHVLGMLDQFNQQNVEFLSLRDAGMDTTNPTGRLFASIVAAFAEFERGLIQERVVAGVRRAQAQGKHCGRPRKDTTDKSLEAARTLLATGWSWRAVAEATGVHKDTLRRRLKEQGVGGACGGGGAKGSPQPGVEKPAQKAGAKCVSKGVGFATNRDHPATKPQRMGQVEDAA